VRDRLLHHAIYRILYPAFNTIFVSDSFSCRLEKGTHKAVRRFQKMFYKVSKNNTKNCWVLKCDIKKFFDSIDHSILFQIIRQKVGDPDILWLLKEIIQSFNKDSIQLNLFDLQAQIERERERERERLRPAGAGFQLAT